MVKTLPQTYSHTIAFPSEQDFFPELYERIDKNLERGVPVVYGIEPVQTTSNATRILNRMEKMGVNNAHNFAKGGQLILLDADGLYYAAGIESPKIKKMWRSMFSKYKRTNPSKKDKQVLAVYFPDSYFTRDYKDPFVFFEKAMTKDLEYPVELLCWYKRKWLDGLSFPQIVHILVSHRYVVRCDWKYDLVEQKKLIDIIEHCVEQELGEEAFVLMMETMRTRFHFTKDDIISRPEVFEDLMKRILLRKDGNREVAAISEALKANVSFEQGAAKSS